MISLNARVIEKVFKIINMRKIVSNMMLDPKRNDKYEKPNKKFFRKYNVNCNIIDGCKCVTVKTSVTPIKHILYFHGGAYTLQASKMHWRIIDDIITNVDCSITFINYPLSPENTCYDTLAFVKKAYALFFQNSVKDLILMGDSSGGGLALSLAQLIKADNTQSKPKKIILLSPWLDLSLDVQISNQKQEEDLILDKNILKIVGKRYAGKMSIDNHKCSPLNGDFNNIGEIAIFTGTSDILNLQAKRLKEILNDADVKLYYSEYKRMQHVWMGFPIPEAKKVMAEIIDYINS